jgi:hypothetical protein
MASEAYWATVEGSIGIHLHKGSSILAHVWEAQGCFWTAIMAQMDGKNLGPIHGPYLSEDHGREQAERILGFSEKAS